VEELAALQEQEFANNCGYHYNLEFHNFIGMSLLGNNNLQPSSAQKWQKVHNGCNSEHQEFIQLSRRHGVAAIALYMQNHMLADAQIYACLTTSSSSACTGPSHC
jgi:hypothetical protein